MTYDYGRFIRVNLADGRTEELRVSERELRRFLGGNGIGAKLLIDEGDDEAIVVANGLLTGQTVPTACKTSFVFRSPLTGIFGETSVGGKWGAQLKRTGLDGLIIRGRSDRPVYLFIDNEGVQVRDAAAYWGLDTFAAHAKLTADLPSGSQIGVIGPGGENLVRYASVMFEGEFPRAAGRTGIGCSFGRKRLKGLAVKGERKPLPVNPTGLMEYTRELNRRIREKTAKFHENGTAGRIAGREVSGDLPIKNFSLGNWTAGAQRITAQVYGEITTRSHHGCFACPIACAKRIEVRDGVYKGLKMAQPEYESAAALGSNVLSGDPIEVAVANMLCNRYGIDTISAGVVLGFFFECVERGIIRPEDTGLRKGRPVWGDHEAIKELLRMISQREGIGDVLAEGVREAARRIGGGSEHFAVHAKGLELPMHDPRTLVSMAVTYATGNRGGSHNESFSQYLDEGLKIRGLDFPEKVDPHASEGKGIIAAQMQDLRGVFDALGLCTFLLVADVSLDELSRLVELTCGWSLDAAELLRAGDRAFTLKRLYNQRRGVNRADDTLTDRVHREARPTGEAAGVLPDMDRMLDELYRERGWDENGQVTPAKAADLGLTEYLVQTDRNDG